MPSIFPGMDPYLEEPPFWGVLHGTMITAMMGEVKKRLPPGYSVWSDIYVWLHEPPADKRRGKPDVFVTGKGRANGGVTTLTGPAVSILPAVRREGSKYLKIKEARTNRVITVIELISPNIKQAGEDRDAYLAKRNEYLATGTNLVEIDLHRAGQRLEMGQPPPPASDYYALVCRAVEFPRTVIWPFNVRDPLPEIPVPLRSEDHWIPLPLQTCFAWSYDQGPFEREVDYTQAPAGPLAKRDARWLKELLRNAGRAS